MSIEPKLPTLSRAATRTALYYFREEDRALYALPFAGGLPRKAGTLRPYDSGSLVESPGGFTVSPDDAMVVWTVGNSREIDLELIPDFR